jgi:transposase-like protein
MNRRSEKTVEESEKYWTEVIENARKHPQGVRAYCTAHDINLNSYYLWFKRLRRLHPEWTDLSNTPPEPRKKAKRQTQPETEVPPRARRRKFSASERARILRETDGCSNAKVAAILRREGLYTAQLHQWRLERERAMHQARKNKPGRVANPLTGRMSELQTQCVRLEKQLKQANAIMELQKKVSAVLGIVLEESME